MVKRGRSWTHHMWDKPLESDSKDLVAATRTAQAGKEVRERERKRESVCVVYVWV